ncbi:MAG TPA: DUF2189 domain-containing protein, partial [Steroidobacteraceae bacterium]|nr:DUF2189 domain-containing protein [Steroidobacteraceae bacterium]
MTENSGAPGAASELPFVAPCRTIEVAAPLQWVRRGWADLRAAPHLSLGYGGVVVILSWAVAYITVHFGGYWELLSLLSGFIFIAPILAIGTYAISDQLERGVRPSLRSCLREERRAFGNLMVFALMVL